MEVLDLKRSRLYALLLTLAVLLAAAPAMGAWEKAPGAAYKVSADRPATVGELSSLDKIEASKKGSFVNPVGHTGFQMFLGKSKSSFPAIRKLFKITLPTVRNPLAIALPARRTLLYPSTMALVMRL